MIQESGRRFLAATEAATRLNVTPRRIYAMVKAGRLRAERVGGRLLVDGDSVESVARGGLRAGRPLSPRRSWALIILAGQEEPAGLDAVTRSKLRRLLKERDLWAMRARLAARAIRHDLRAHSSDLARLEREPGLVRTGARFAAEAGLRLHAPDAPLEFYVDARAADDLVARYRLTRSSEPNLVLRVVPDQVRRWLRGPVAPRIAVALDLAEDRDARSQDVAREALSPT